MTDRNRLYTGAAIGLVAAAALGFGAARLTQSPAPAPVATEAAAPAKPSNTVAMTSQALAASQIAVAPAAAGETGATHAPLPREEARLAAETPLPKGAPSAPERGCETGQIRSSKRRRKGRFFASKTLKKPRPINILAPTTLRCTRALFRVTQVALPDSFFCPF